MKVVALVSGGKDSCYAMMKCLQYGHQIVALANLLPSDDSVDELDSYMYQTVGHQMIESLAKCMGLPLFRRRIRGSTRHHNLSYRPTPGDEVEDMYILLKEVKRQIPSVQAVSSGAIASDYQRLRVESVCSRLGLVSLAFLWKQDQSLLLQEMIDGGIVAITVKVAAIGLNPAKHLGKELSSLYQYLHKLKELYGINVCGEGGEYESLTLDCPLFTNARIVLDEFEIILHSPDSIAPVGVLHPLTFHLEDKLLGDHDKTNDPDYKRMSLVHDVQDDHLEECNYPNSYIADTTDLAEVTEDRLKMSMTERGQTFSITCWLQDSSQVSSELQDDLKDVLRKIEARLARSGLAWKDVLYIHLYIADMNKFAVANETYVKFITQEKCPLGVPSRSTVELPLLQAGLGKAYLEVLVTNKESKRVLHVQSISCWAPSCIGPYSQATFHQNVLYMAGQLGLDPPTMNICSGGLLAELDQALLNSEAVGKSFNLSIATSSIMLVVYCSAVIPLSERSRIQEKVENSLKQMRSPYLDKRITEVFDPVFLYVLVPSLPKSALVEIKPVLYALDDEESTTENISSVHSTNWGFQHESWHESCIQKCVVSGRICTAVLSITSDVAAKICSDHRDRKMDPISRFCVYILDKFLAEQGFSWKDVMSLRIYFPTRLHLSLETLSHTFNNAFKELAETNRGFKSTEESIFNLVPVVGVGNSSSSSMEDNVFTCELFAQR